MRYYTKEWYTLMSSLGAADMFEPVIDKAYSDEEIENLYQEMLEKYVQEEHDMYDEPPVMEMFEEDDPEEEFDPEDYLIGDFDGEGNEINLRNPESLEELKEYQRKELQMALAEYESREPFDEEEAREDFEEMYRDSLEEPDEDIPQWVLDSVDRRLIAMGVLPEKTYIRLVKEEAAREEQFDKLDEAADDALEQAYDDLPEEFREIADELDEVDGEYVAEVRMENGDLEIVFSAWDDEGDPIRITLDLSSAEILEDEGLEITAEVDEDGDLMSDCSLENHELYYEDGKAELHMLFDNEEHGLKYMTVRCVDIGIYQG